MDITIGFIAVSISSWVVAEIVIGRYHFIMWLVCVTVYLLVL